MRLIRSVLFACFTTAAVTLPMAPVAADEPLLSDLSVVSVTFDPKTGWAFVEVSVTCAEEIEAVEFWATVRQGRAFEDYDNWGDCIEGTATTTVVISEIYDGDRFRGGPALISVSADGYCYETPYCGARLTVQNVPWKLTARR
jgi:hypothetical protein